MTQDGDTARGTGSGTDGVEQVSAAITDARLAARAAGFPDSAPDDEETAEELAARPKVSYAFELTGHLSAPDLAEIEAALEAVPGVRARIVYPTATAWITAPDTVEPDALAGIIAGFGLRAVLTDSSLRRRVLHPLAGETTRPERRRAFRRRGVPWKFRRHLEDEARALERARRAGFLDAADRARDAAPPTQAEPRDVLFTARTLLTPRRLVVTALLSVPVLLLSYAPAWQFDGWQWLTLALAAPVVTWGAWPFHRAMVGGVRRGLTALDAASSVAIISAVLWSLVMLLFTPAGELDWKSSPRWFAFDHDRISQGELFLDVACGMTVLLLAGRLLTMRNRASLLDEMAAHRPPPTHPVLVTHRDRVTGRSRSERIPLQEVNVGDDILVEAGEVIPVDGRVVGGASRVAPGLIETSRAGTDAAEVKVNSFVYAGTRNLDGRLKVRVVRTGHRTRMAAIHRWVTEATRQLNRSTLLSTRTAAVLIPVALGLAALDFLLWGMIGGNFNAAFATALAVLACVAPVAIALSPALAIRHGIEAAARHGILVRDGATIRRLEMVDTVIFNRVGTLVEPTMTVETVTAARGENTDLVLRVAGALALESNHPASRALVRAAREARDTGAGGEAVPHWINVTHSEVTPDGDFRGLIELSHTDSDGTVHNRQVEALLWRPSNMSTLQGRLATAAVSGGTPLVVRWNGRDRGVITLHDPVKHDAEDAVEALEGMGVETMMLSRDIYPVARRFADRLGISRVLAGIVPRRKALTVRAVHTRGASVAMVGDASVVDTLRVADVGILMGGTEERDADVVILRDDVATIPQLISLSRRICRIIDRNIVFAWTYNGLAVLASVAGVLHPMAATVLMLGSSLFIEARSNSARMFPR